MLSYHFGSDYNDDAAPTSGRAIKPFLHLTILSSSQILLAYCSVLAFVRYVGGLRRAVEAETCRSQQCLR